MTVGDLTFWVFCHLCRQSLDDVDIHEAHHFVSRHNATCGPVVTSVPSLLGEQIAEHATAFLEAQP